MIQSSQTLAEVALQFPSASRIFRHHRLDFCCGGQRSIADACTARGVDPVAIIADIETSGPAPADTDWQTRSLTDLIEHILVNYHEAHRRELPDLIDLALKVERVHSDKANVPVGLSAHLVTMQEALELHMQKEEHILFPAICRGQGRHMLAPTQQMQLEHEQHGESLRQLRELAGNFVPPAEACTSWRALLLRCEQLEADIMDHVHLENHVLFPRALRGDH
jgi:regulator of cell morphogenesis and NO signaling